MSFSDYLSPLNSEEFTNESSDYLIKNINFKDVKNPKEKSIAIIGIVESEENLKKQGCSIVRKHLYKLAQINSLPIIYDLGNFIKSKNPKDTYFAISNIVEALLKRHILPIIIGGGQELTFSNYTAYQNLEESVNLVSISNNLNIGDASAKLSSDNFISKILQHQPTHLFNYSNLCYQNYYTNPKELLLLDKLYFNSYRLGEVQKNIEEIEPVIRDATILSFSSSSLRFSEFPSVTSPPPNGLYGEQACKLAYYAGISDKLSSAGFYDYVPELDKREQSAKQLSQIIWHFLEGVASRKKDYPIGSKKKYLKYNVEIHHGDYEIIFYKSPSGRWWMEIQIPSDKTSKYKRAILIPCSEKDYKEAINGEFPDSWWKAYQKLI